MWDLFKHLMGLVARTVVIGQLAKLAFFYFSSCPIEIWPVVIGKLAKLASCPITTGQIVIGQLAKFKKCCSFYRFNWPIWPVVLLASCNRTTTLDPACCHRRTTSPIRNAGFTYVIRWMRGKRYRRMLVLQVFSRTY